MPKETTVATNQEQVSEVTTEAPAETVNAVQEGAQDGAQVEEEAPVDEEEGTAEQYEKRIVDIEERKSGFRADLEALVEKWRIAPDAHAVYSQHGVKVGVVLIDLKYGANLDERLPTFEEEQAMHQMMTRVAAMPSK